MPTAATAANAFVRQFFRSASTVPPLATTLFIDPSWGVEVKDRDRLLLKEHWLDVDQAPAWLFLGQVRARRVGRVANGLNGSAQLLRRATKEVGPRADFVLLVERDKRAIKADLPGIVGHRLFSLWWEISSGTGSPRVGRRRRPAYDDGAPCPKEKRGQRLLRLVAISARLDTDVI